VEFIGKFRGVSNPLFLSRESDPSDLYQVGHRLTKVNISVIEKG